MKDSFLQFLGLCKRAGKLAEGYNKCEEFLKFKKAFLCIMSTELSSNSYEKFVRLCENNNIPVIHAYNKEELGSVIGREEINILCITDRIMGSRLIEIFNANQNNRG
ncbi:MAG: ribosomal L7Ae/L30e/S12e/Gadd45 family protein [Bacillota bacterium]|nr:ribosomal L7Ae/L30e/S12e/Gadd45 family protein [Bacillota bacterium]